jgi:hypothetical protein
MTEPKHSAQCWYEPDALGWRCVPGCPVLKAQKPLL